MRREVPGTPTGPGRGRARGTGCPASAADEVQEVSDVEGGEGVVVEAGRGDPLGAAGGEPGGDVVAELGLEQGDALPAPHAVADRVLDLDRVRARAVGEDDADGARDRPLVGV